MQRRLGPANSTLELMRIAQRYDKVVLLPKRPRSPAPQRREADILTFTGFRSR